MGDEATHIEVELVPSSGDESESPFARPRGDAPPGGVAPDRGDRRVLAIAVAVGVVALALGWMLGRSAAETSTPIGDVGATTAVPPTEEPIDSADEASPMTASVATSIAAPAPEPPAPTSLDSAPSAAEQVVEQVEVASAVSDQPVEVVVYGNGSQLLRLDLTSGRLISQTVTRQPFGRPRIVVGSEWVMFPTTDAQFPTIVVESDGSTRTLELGENWRVAGSTDDTLWLVTPELAVGAAAPIVQVTSDGAELGGVELPGLPTRFDPLGGFVVDAPGGSYRVTDDDRIRITDGELIAIGTDLAVAEECDETLTCTVVVIDRATGERRAIALDRPLSGSQLPTPVIVGGESVSPGGSHAMVKVAKPSDTLSGQATLGVLDLTTGDVTEVGPAQDIDQSVWSPDGRFLFYIRGGKAVAFEPATGESVVIADELIAIDAFAVRPLSR